VVHHQLDAARHRRQSPFANPYIARVLKSQNLI
jgi:hypothetical protein